jgi:hypothetical protein
MEKFILKETTRTPSVSFDPERGLFEIKGKSIPENSTGFFGPLLEYMDNYCKSPANRTILDVKLEYFNTSSTNRIHSLFKKFDRLYKDDYDVLIRWYCESGDENLRDAGKDFKAMLQVPFEIVEVEEL